MNGQVVKLLDTVAPLELPGKYLHQGQVGTVVEELAKDVYEVEFGDGACVRTAAAMQSEAHHAELAA